MNKAGLFGGGWEDYLDALNGAFDRHAAENAPPHPFGASVDAILTGYPDDAGVSPQTSSGDLAGGFPDGMYASAGARRSGLSQARPNDIETPLSSPVLQNIALQASPAGLPAPLASDASSIPQASQGGLGAVAGYPEIGSGAYRAANDDVIRNAANAYNNRNGYRQGDPGYISPELMKAWQMQESGGGRSKDRAAFESDPFQVNNPGDWFDDKAKILGLTKGQAMTPQTSAEAALKWLQYKSWVHDHTGKPVTYKGVQQGFDSYNGGGVKGYGSSVVDHYNQSWGK